MNKVILKARLTKDIELRYSQSATPVAFCSFSVAVNGYNDRVDFINCGAFGKTAEIISKHFVKGQEILIDGRIQVDTVTGDNGENRTYTKVIVNQFEFCGSKASNSSGETNRLFEENNASDPDDNEEELPF